MANKIEIKSYDVDSSFADEMKTWLTKKTSELNSKEIYLLSFHDDGVVWGRLNGKELKTSDFPNSPSPEFRSGTFQELRLFGENGQLHIWRTGENQFNASLALENYLKDFESIDESQVLNGTCIEKDKDGNDLVNNYFMVVKDGSEGLKHAFPIADKTKFDDKKRPLRLNVKRYIEYDNDGCARIAFSRLVNVSVK